MLLLDKSSNLSKILGKELDLVPRKCQLLGKFNYQFVHIRRKHEVIFWFFVFSFKKGPLHSYPLSPPVSSNTGSSQRVYN